MSAVKQKLRDLQNIVTQVAGTRACNCIGPQNGQPLCPCMMRGVKVRNGRYVQVIDHGPAPDNAEDDGIPPELSAKWDRTMEKYGL